MTTLRALDHVVAGGPFSEPWHPHRGVDAWLRSARGALAAMNDEVRRLDQPWESPAVLVDVQPADDEVVSVEVRRHRPAVRVATVRVPASIADLTPGRRAGLVVEVWAGVLDALGSEVLARAVAGVHEAMVWYGAPRDLGEGDAGRVRACYADDGFARLVVQVRRADGTELTSPALVGWCTNTSIEAAQLSLKEAGGAVLVEPCVDAWERSAGVVTVTDDDFTLAASGDPLESFVVTPEPSDVPLQVRITDEPEDVMALYSEVMTAGLEAAQRPLDVPRGFVD